MLLKAASQCSTANPRVFKPQLTSLVDVMTILLLFLIKNFSVEGSFITAPADINLPLSITDQIVTQPVSIEITGTSIRSGEVEIIKHSEYLEIDSFLIEPLYSWLKNNHTGEVSEKEPGVSSLMLQSDRDVEFKIIKRIMHTCSKAGVSDFTVLVLKEEQ